MEQNSIKDMKSNQRVGGYDVVNFFDDTVFMSKRNKKPELSFIIKDIVVVDGNEILKLLFLKKNGLVARIMKYTNEDQKPCMVFDLVDEDKKEIVLASSKEFVSAFGMDDYFFKTGLITQWEIPVFNQLCRGFIFGDSESFLNLVNVYNLKFQKDVEWKLKILLGISS